MFADDERGKTVRAGFLTRVPKGRLGEPEDLVDPLPFLALEGLRLLHRLRSLRRRRLHGRLTVSTQRPATLLLEKRAEMGPRRTSTALPSRSVGQLWERPHRYLAWRSRRSCRSTLMLSRCKAKFKAREVTNE